MECLALLNVSVNVYTWPFAIFSENQSLHLARSSFLCPRKHLFIANNVVWQIVKSLNLIENIKIITQKFGVLTYSVYWIDILIQPHFGLNVNANRYLNLNSLPFTTQLITFRREIQKLHFDFEEMLIRLNRYILRRPQKYDDISKLVLTLLDNFK